MTIKVFRLKGFLKQTGGSQKFTVDYRATKEEAAREHVFSDMGSRHKLKRNQIVIESVEEIAAKDSKNLVVQQLGGA